MSEKTPFAIPLADLDRYIGQDLGPSRWHVMSQDRVGQFADATEDHQWIHVDTERARREMGGTIAHGFLTLSMLPVIMEELLTVTGVGHMFNYGLNRVRFTRPVKVGSRIRGRKRIVSVTQKGDGQLVICEMTIEIEGESSPACIAETLILFLPATQAVEATGA